MLTELPADLTGLTADELAALEDALVAEFDEMHDSGEVDLAVATEIADALDAVRGRIAEVEQEAADAAAAAEALARRIRPEVTEDPSDEDADADATADAGDDDPTGDEDPDTGGNASDENDSAAEREPAVVASTRRTSARRVAARAPRPQVPQGGDAPTVTITAAADVPGFANGQVLGIEDVARAMHRRARGLANRSPRVGVATVTVPIPDAHRIPEGASPSLIASVMDQVANPSRLGQALTAAGGWCAPSMPLYELFEVEAADGLLDLPTIGVQRGGIGVPEFFGFGDAADALWTWTEDDDITALDNDGGDDPEDTVKPCLRIPCPEFTDYRLQADGLCLTHGNLSNEAYPELTSRFVRLALNGHLHRMSALQIAAIVATSEAFAPGGVASDASADLLNAIDITVANLRSRHRLANSALVEVVLPHWTAAMLRSNFAARAGVAMTNVSDADVAAHLAVRSVRPQFVHGYQPLYSGSMAANWPGTIRFLAYPAGGYVLGNGGSIDLGVVRDSKLNETNDYTAAWTEQFWLLAQRGPDAIEATVPISVDGVTGCCPIPEDDD